MSELYYTPWIFKIITSSFEYVAGTLLEAGGYLFPLFQYLYIRNFERSTRQQRPNLMTGTSDIANESVDWENPRIVGRNKRDSHTILRSFKSVEATHLFWKEINNTREMDLCNKYYLTGPPGDADKSRRWSFLMIGKPSLAPLSWQSANFVSPEEWKFMSLPCHWQLSGVCDDIPIYTNTVYPFRFDPPRTRRDGAWQATDCDSFIGGSLPDPTQTTYDLIGENVTGLFRHEFQLPPDWSPEHDRIFIVFEGVDSALSVWINGQYLGYSQDSCLPAEFEITDFLSLKDGLHPHLLACQVSRWCDGSYLEDQDKWWLSGIYREVYIYKKPKACMMSDFEVKYKLKWCDNSEDSVCSRAESADLQIIVQVECDCSIFLPESFEVQATLSDSSGNVVCNKLSSAVNSAVVEMSLVETAVDTCDIYEAEVAIPNSNYTEFTATVSGNIISPNLWCAEEPNLYTLTLCLVEKSAVFSKVIDVESCRIGFREVRIGGENNTLQINRRSIVVAGVNRHEFDCRQGRAVSLDTMIQDARAMKSLNFNAARLSHYPPHHLWIEICDEAGIYVIDEANIETHGFQVIGTPVGYLSSLPEWRGAMLSRCGRMFERDKNFSSVIGWSLGNESGLGPAHDAMYNWIKMRDNSRFVQYEAGGSRSAVTDIICPMYRRPDWCQYYSLHDKQQRPVILCEYSHAMGNSSGGLSHYWSLFWDESLPRLQGGFIWDWIDQGIHFETDPRVAAESARFRYGGDFGDKPNSKQFCINGIIGPDRVPHPIAYEASALQAPIMFRLDNTSLIIKNRRSHSTLSNIGIRFAIGSDFRPTDSSSLYVILPLHFYSQVSPGAEVTVDLKEFWTEMMHNFHLNAALDMFHSDKSCIWLDIVVEQLLDNKYINKGCELLRTTLQGSVLSENVFQSYSSVPQKELKADSKLQMVSYIIDDEENYKILWSSGGAAVLGKDCGRLLSWNVNISGRIVNLLTAPIEIDFWRAPTDNDRGGAEMSYLSQWKAFGINALKQHRASVIIRETNEDSIVIESSFSYLSESVLIPTEIACSMRYSFLSCGDVSVEFSARLPSKMPSIPRFGLRCALTKNFTNCEYLGLGPHESYDDRKSCATQGLFRSSVSELHVPYVFPQECGRRASPRLISLNSDIDLTKFNIFPSIDHSSRDWGWSASYFSREMLESCDHDYELKRSENEDVYVHIDRYMMGVGGYDSWSPNVAEQFLIKDKFMTGKILFSAVPTDSSRR